MAWLGLDKLLLGVDLTEEQKRADQAAADTAAWQQQKLQSGQWSLTQYQTAQQDLQQQIAENSDVVGQVDQAFVEGAQQGLNNVLTAPGKVVGFAGSSLTTALWGILKNIPWWVYLVGLGALFVWMGGLNLLRGRFHKPA